MSRNRVVHRGARGIVIVLLLAFVLPVLPATITRAANGTYYVGSAADTQRTSPPPDCTSATTSDCTLREAVAAAASGTDTIRFRAVVDGLSIAPTSTITLSAGVTIVGNGPAKTIIHASAHSVTVFQIVLDNGLAALSGMTISGGSTGIENGVFGVPHNGTASVTNVIFSDNTDAIDNNFSSHTNMTVSNSTFTGNGNGIDVSDTDAVAVTTSTFTGNHIHAIYIHNGTVTITNSTLANNPSEGIYNNGGAITVANTIIAGNVYVGDRNCSSVGGSLTDNGHNLEYGTSGPTNTCGFTTAAPQSDVLADPKLGPLQDNGGPIPTMALLAGSAAIDAGGDARNFCSLQDQRGAVRPQGSYCDIGAFEAGTIITTTTLAASPNPTIFGQSVTLTATVAGVLADSSFATNPGTVTFKDGTATLGTATLDASGVATFTTTSLTAGSHTLTATYSGNANYAGSDSPVVTQQVNPAPAPTIAFAPSNVAFGNITVGMSSTKSVTVTDTGVAPLTFPTGGVTYTPAATGDAQIAISGDTCSGQTILPQGSTGTTTCAVTLKYQPTGATATSGSLGFTDNAPGSPQKLSVSGTGVAAPTIPPTLTASPERVPFGQFSTTITWSTGDGSQGTVCVTANGGTEQPFAAGATDTRDASFINSGTYRFTLHAGDTCAGGVLAGVTVTKLNPKGTTGPAITASPASFSFAKSTTDLVRSSTISFDTGDGSVGQVMLSVNGDTPRLFAAAQYGTLTAPWVFSGTYTFTLIKNGQQVDLVAVKTTAQISSPSGTTAGGASPDVTTSKGAGVLLTFDTGTGQPAALCTQYGGLVSFSQNGTGYASVNNPGTVIYDLHVGNCSGSKATPGTVTITST